MAERRGPEGEPTPEHDPASENGPASGTDSASEANTVSTDAVAECGGAAQEIGSGEHDRNIGSHGADDRARDAADEGTELIEDHRASGVDAEAGSAESASAEVVGDQTAGSGAGGDEVAEGEESAEQRSTVLTFPSGEQDDVETEDLVDLDEVGDEPIDLAELRADAALLDALGGTDPDFSARTRGKAPDVETLLTAWRQDIDAAPIGDLVDTDTAVTTIAEAQRRPWRRLKRRHLVPVASAAAVLMIGFTGVGLAAKDAMPGDMLWGVAKVFYTDHTQTVQAAVSAQSDFQYAEQAWQHNRSHDAREAFKRGNQQMQAVDREHGLEDLRATQESLANRFQRGHYQPPRSATSTPTSVPDQLPPSSPSQPNPSVPPSMPPAPPTATSPSGPPSSSQEPTGPTSTPSETSGGSSDYPYPSSGTTRNSGSSGLFAPRSQ